MKRFFASLLSAFGAKSSEKAAPKVQMVDINQIIYTMPSVSADEIKFVLPTKDSFEGAPQFHEDDWAQLEFFSKERLLEIQNQLQDLKSFEQKHRIKHGWNNILARRISRQPIFEKETTPQALSESTSSQLLPAPILFITSAPLGQVDNGFSMLLGENAYLYGLVNNQSVTVLAAHLAGADDMLLTHAFTLLNRNYGLILVDWTQKFLLSSVSEDGAIQMWRP